jgi:hypothetical protein
VPLFPYDQDRLTGYIDATGKVVLKPKFFAGLVFRDGVAEYSGHNERVFIDERGRELFRVTAFGLHEPFGPDGLAFFSRWDESQRQRASFRDLRGKEHVLDLDDAATPREGLAAGRRSRGPGATWNGSASYRSPYDDSTRPWGYVDTAGKLVIRERYFLARPFFEGRAAVAERTGEQVRWSFINARGAAIPGPSYDAVTDFEGGLASVGTKDGKVKRPKKGTWWDLYDHSWGTVDAGGHPKLPPSFRWPLRFREGHAATCQKPLAHAFVDAAGRFVGKARFVALHALERGAAPAKDEATQKWGLVDAGGAWLLEPRFELLDPFVDGLARFIHRSSRTMGKTKCGYLDPEGRVVFEYTR